MGGEAGPAGRPVESLLHDLGNSLTLLAVLAASLEDVVDPAGRPVVASLERAIAEASAKLQELRDAWQTGSSES